MRVASPSASRAAGPRPAASDPAAARLVLLGLAFGFLCFFLVLPLASVFAEAFSEGPGPYVAALLDEGTLAAARLSLLAVAVAVPLNAAFGVAAAWAVARFDFRGKSVLVTLIDLPFAVSPVISGMLFVLLFGARGVFGELVRESGFRVIFSEPGIILATTFVTAPFVARELIPFMEAQGSDEEQAALVLGASGPATFFRVTLPNVKWGLLYGVVLASARAMGEFGAVSVVSGHIHGKTNTLPLHVEALYNEYRFSSAFAVASLLVFFSLAILAAKRLLEHRAARELAATRSPEEGREPGEAGEAARR